MDIYQKVAALISISLEKAHEYSQDLPSHNAIRIWDPSRGSQSIIIDHSGKHLIANSSVNPDDHIKEFANGRRAPK